MKLMYRPEIDGLRAIAVLLVIFYHFKLSFIGFEPFNGGFLGVDIFFIISGFLITSILMSDNKKSSGINLIIFLERRLRRILPALIVFVFFITIILIILFKNYEKLFFLNLDHIIKSLLFVSNDVFSDYFDPGRDGNISYHTWSLSVEIQIYILFMIGFYLIKDLPSKYQILTILLTLFITGVLTQLGANLKFESPWIDENFYFFNQPYWAGFYSPISRLFEFCAGSLCALLKMDNSKWSKNFLSYFGLILIIGSLYYFDDTIFHPGLYTLPLIFGTSFMLINNNSNFIINQILSSKYVSFIGKISYSTYLFHVPIIFLINFYFFKINSLLKLFLIIFFTFLISSISYYFIENRFRAKKLKSITFMKFLVYSYIVIISIVIYFKFYEKAEIKYNRIDMLTERVEYLDKLRTKTKIAGEEINFSKHNFTTNKLKILIIGNSISEDMFLTFEINKSLFQNYEFKYFRMQISNFLKKNKREKEIQNFFTNSKLFQESDVILISTNFRKYGRYSRDIESLDEILKITKKFNKKLVLTSNVPQFGSIFSPVEDVIFKYNLKFNEREKINKEVYKLINKKEYLKNKTIEKFAKQNDIIFLNKLNYMCSKTLKECDALSKDLKINLKDALHISLDGAKNYGNKISKTNWFSVD